MSEALKTLEEPPEPLPVDWQQGKGIGACLLEMYDRCLWTDVMFHCKDHEEREVIKAHKIVLAARSPVFQAMFFGPCADGKDEVNLKNVEKDIFPLVLRYIYSDKVTLTEENATAVLRLAHCYQVSSLVQYCADYLATVITPENACEILTIAMQYQISSLKGICCSFVDDHAQQVLKSEGFLNLSEECLLFILKGDTFYAKEEEVLETAEKWSKRRVLESGMAENGKNVRTFLGKSFYQLRLPTMTNKALLEYTSRKGYFSTEEYADIAGWINKVYGIKVSTNSCVARVPLQEILQVNADRRCYYDGNEEVIRDNISCSFEIAVSKEVALTNITLSEIKPQLGKLYTDEGCHSKHFKHVHKEDKLSAILYYTGYEDIVIKLRAVDTKGSNIYNASLLKPLQETHPLDLVLSGNISIKCLEFKQSFNIQQQQNENGTVTLTTPLVLKKRNDPYLVSFDIRYNCGLKMKTSYCRSIEPISNSDGTIKLHNKDFDGNSFLGIKSIGFLNFSNRDNDSDPETSEKKHG